MKIKDILNEYFDIKKVGILFFKHEKAVLKEKFLNQIKNNIRYEINNVRLKSIEYYNECLYEKVYGVMGETSFGTPIYGTYKVKKSWKEFNDDVLKAKEDVLLNENQNNINNMKW